MEVRGGASNGVAPAAMYVPGRAATIVPGRRAYAVLEPGSPGRVPWEAEMGQTPRSCREDPERLKAEE